LRKFNLMSSKRKSKEKVCSLKLNIEDRCNKVSLESDQLLLRARFLDKNMSTQNSLTKNLRIQNSVSTAFITQSVRPHNNLELWF
jgi:hypothetical protein